MKPLVIALIAVAIVAIGFWFFWRRRQSRTGATDSDRFSDTVITDANKISSQPSKGLMASVSTENHRRQTECNSSVRQETSVCTTPGEPEADSGVENSIASSEEKQPPESQSRNPQLQASEIKSEEGVAWPAQNEQAAALEPESPIHAPRHGDDHVEKNAVPTVLAQADAPTVIREQKAECSELSATIRPPYVSDPSLTETVGTDHGNASTNIGTSDHSGERMAEQETVLTEIASPADNVAQTKGTAIEMEALTATHVSSEELSPTDLATEPAQPSHETEQSSDADGEKRSKRYRSPSQRPPRPADPRSANSRPEPVVPSSLSLGIHVRLTFDRFGFCEIGLLPERTSDLENEIEVKVGGTTLRLAAQEDWYQDLQFENVGDYLRGSLELKGRLADNRLIRWLLTGRDLYVLASHQRASGFISTPRLLLGRSHIVLCTNDLLQRVEAVLNEAGCQRYTKLDESVGVPRGWVALRDVCPTKPIPLNAGSDPFYPIKPAPDIEIQVEGGVCLRNSVWLAGYPPQIKLLGQLNGAVKVLIDGKEAHHTPDGFLIADGYDRSGQQHSVYCEGLSCSCSYSIEEPPDSWQEWRAYQFGQADICGPLVRPMAEAASNRPFSVPMSNPLLLGAEPGQIFRCSARSVAHWKGFVPFDVVWALPAYPLSSDKKTARVLQFASAPVSQAKHHTKAVLDWCRAILDASRKGLRIGSDSEEAARRWADYKKTARKIWRAAR